MPQSKKRQTNKCDYKQTTNNLIDCSYVRYVFVLPKLIIDFNATRCQDTSINQQRMLFVNNIEAVLSD